MRRSSHGAVLGGGLALALIVGAVVLAKISTSEDKNLAQVPGAAASLPPAAGVTDVGVVPLPTYNSVVAWTGSHLLTFGGSYDPDRQSNAGASYEPASGVWTPIADAPFDPTLTGVAGVWNGHELIVVGVLCANKPAEDEAHCSPGTLAAGAYSPEDEAWRQLPDPPAPGRGNSTDPNFGRSIGSIDGDAIFQVADRLIAYNAAKGTWSSIADRPTADACTVQDEIATWQSTQGGIAIDNSGGKVALALYSLDGTGWQDTAPPDVDTLEDWSALCTDTGVLVFDQQVENVWLYDVATRTWTQQPAAPRELARQPIPDGAKPLDGFQFPIHFGSHAWTGRAVAFWNSPLTSSDVDPETGKPRSATIPPFAIAYDPKTKAWSSAQGGPLLIAAVNNHDWVDGYAFIVDANRDRGLDLSLYSPT
jgi:hypothetical protein